MYERKRYENLCTENQHEIAPQYFGNAEMYLQGAMGVVLNAPVSNLNLSAVTMAVDIPVIITVTKKNTDILSRIESGATILNVACAQDTPEVVASIRQNFPDIPIIASGGKTEESILKTIEAGANSITYTPPSTQELFKEMMLKYREN